GYLTFEQGNASEILTLTVLDDLLQEGTESVALLLSSGLDYALGSASLATILITDDDIPTLSISASDPSAAEQGLDPAVFVLSRTGSTASLLTVSLSWTGDASRGVDYSWLPDSVTFSTGVSTLSLTLTPIDDRQPEPLESVVV